MHDEKASDAVAADHRAREGVLKHLRYCFRQPSEGDAFMRVMPHCVNRGSFRERAAEQRCEHGPVCRRCPRSIGIGHCIRAGFRVLFDEGSAPLREAMSSRVLGNLVRSRDTALADYQSVLRSRGVLCVARLFGIFPSKQPIFEDRACKRTTLAKPNGSTKTRGTPGGREIKRQNIGGRHP